VGGEGRSAWKHDYAFEVKPIRLMATLTAVISTALPGTLAGAAKDPLRPAVVACANADLTGVVFRDAPRSCNLLKRRGSGSRDATFARDLHWRLWGAPTAKGEGVARIGAHLAPPVTIVLRAPVNRCGHRVYSRVVTRGEGGGFAYPLYTCPRVRPRS